MCPLLWRSFRRMRAKPLRPARADDRTVIRRCSWLVARKSRAVRQKKQELGPHRPPRRRCWTNLALGCANKLARPAWPALRAGAGAAVEPHRSLPCCRDLAGLGFVPYRSSGNAEARTRHCRSSIQSWTSSTGTERAAPPARPVIEASLRNCGAHSRTGGDPVGMLTHHLVHDEVGVGFSGAAVHTPAGIAARMAFGSALLAAANRSGHAP